MEKKEGTIGHWSNSWLDRIYFTYAKTFNQHLLVV